MPTTDKAVIPAKAGIQFVGLTALKINQMNHLDACAFRHDCLLGNRPGSFYKL